MVRIAFDDEGRPRWTDIAQSIQWRTDMALRDRWERALHLKLQRGRWSLSELHDRSKIVAKAVGQIARSLSTPRTPKQVRMFWCMEIVWIEDRPLKRPLFCVMPSRAMAENGLIFVGDLHGRVDETCRNHVYRILKMRGRWSDSEVCDF